MARPQLYILARTWPLSLEHISVQLKWAQAPCAAHTPPAPSDNLLPASCSLTHPQPSPRPAFSSVLSAPPFQILYLDVTGIPILPGGGGGAWHNTDDKPQRWPGATPAHHPEGTAQPPGPQASEALGRDGKCQASPDPLLLHLFHLLSPRDHPVDDFLLLICQLFLLPLSVGLTTRVDGPAGLEPEK